MLNALYINHTNTVSGAGISLATMLRNLPSDEVEQFFCLHRKSTLADLFGATPERIHRDPLVSMMHTTLYGGDWPWYLPLFHMAKAPATLATLTLLRKKWSPDIVHLNETVLAPYAVAASLLRIPLVIHARTVVRPDSAGMRVLAGVARRGRARFVCIDEETRQSLPNNCRAVAEVIYNPVKLREVPMNESRRKRAEWGIPENAVVVGQMASLHKEKGIWRILDLARELCPELPDLQFVLAGDTSAGAGEGPTLRRAIYEAGLQSRVHLVGYERDCSLAYSAFDVALCLFGEFLGAVGRAAYEAPLAGKPLVATIPDPDRSHAMVSGLTGFALRPDDLRGVASAIRSLIADGSLRLNMGASAKVVIGNRHDPKKHAEKIIQIYRSMINNQKKIKL